MAGSGDEHNIATVIHSLTRLWKASGDDSLLAAIAPIFNETPRKIEELLSQVPPDEK